MSSLHSVQVGLILELGERQMAKKQSNARKRATKKVVKTVMESRAKIVIRSPKRPKKAPSEDDRPRSGFVSRDQMLRDFNGVEPESILEDWG